MKHLLIFYEVLASILVIMFVVASAPLVSTFTFFGAVACFLALAFMLVGALITLFGCLMYSIALIFGDKA